MKKTITLLFFINAFLCVLAQENEEFKPNGAPVVKVFANWHQGMGNEDYEDMSGFEISRAVIGYKYNFSPYISTKVIVDTDNPKSGKLTETAYLRNAYVSYQKDALDVYFGIIGMKQFKAQENNWGYRYIYKSAMDEYKFNSSIGTGTYVKYDLLDWLSADVTLTNGEGAKSQQDAEGKYRTGYGLTLQPAKGLIFRAYYDQWFSPESTDELSYKDHTCIALFLGYVNETFRVGAEYNTLSNYDFDQLDDRDLYSVYGSYVFNKKLQAFARYDNLVADYAGESEWLFMGGLDYSVVKGVKVSPNYRYLDEGESDLEKGHFVYLNFEYKF